MDQGSPGYAASWFLSFHLKTRSFFLMDIFHREWNDCAGAIKGSGLWWVVLLTTVTYNLCYGPWEGAAWFEKLRAGALEYFGLEQ
eukprot:5933651-Lingulodinium_polyedra.AAC.1